MDYFGRFTPLGRRELPYVFQSFWVNGLLWKRRRGENLRARAKVSILLGQWITLEVHLKNIYMWYRREFQSFWVNGLLWKLYLPTNPKHTIRFQSFWVNGLLWKLFLIYFLIKN